MTARVADQLERVGDAARDRPLGGAVGLVGLERDPDAGELGLGGDRAQAVDDDLAGPVGIEVAAGAGQADDPRRRECGQAVDRGAEGVDALLRVGRAAEQRQRQDRGDDRHRRGGLEAAALERLERGRVVAVLGQLQLPDPDPVEPGRA